ncbi:hypothetical protein JEM67_09790 [Serratia sp. PAMC26656]|uniref:hypothetical protein n=1 Tax=Serratia sp. PAMC26656 TaxID=2775909 RepID=UPI0018F2F30F|nr:hypothetical protein [Serratia sp. PAMC26656]MBJ7889569.1 hypothetical protein [Serratia sp. PAMC26656]
MDNKLSELSKPVGYAAKEDIELMQSGRMILGQVTIRGYGEHALYSQEYVSALLSDRDAWQAAAQALRDEFRVSQAIANEYQQLMYHMGAGGDFFEFQRDKNNG